MVGGSITRFASTKFPAFDKVLDCLDGPPLFQLELGISGEAKSEVIRPTQKKALKLDGTIVSGSTSASSRHYCSGCRRLALSSFSDDDSTGEW